MIIVAKSMDKCNCYHESFKIEPRYSQYTGQYVNSVEVKYGYCSGTKECDECSCEGDTAKCDFYPEVRKNGRIAKKTISGIPISRECLSDWYTSYTDGSESASTEEHLDKLFENFYLIPKRNKVGI